MKVFAKIMVLAIMMIVIRENFLNNQGLEAYQIEVNDGESFEIPQSFTGRIEQYEQNYYKKVLVDKGMDYYEREVIQDDLPSGLYQLDKDEIIVKQIYQTDVF